MTVKYPIYSERLFNAVTIAKSGSATYPLRRKGIQLQGKANQGIFAINYTLSGSGTAKIEYLVSDDEVNWRDPSKGSDIASGLTAGSDKLSFSPELANAMKIIVTETGGAASIVMTLDIQIQ